MSRIDELIEQYSPDGVVFKELGEIGELIRGNGLQKKDFTESGAAAIHYGQIYTYYGTFANTTKSFVSPELAKKLKKAQKGDVLISGVSENVEDVCKPMGWLGDEVCISGDMFAFRHNQNPKFITYLLQTIDFQKYKQRNAQGTKVIRVKADKILQYKIPVPALEVQQAVVSVLDSFAELKSELEAELKSELEGRKKQYEHYRKQLLNFDELTDMRWTTMAEIADFINAKPHEKLVDPEGDVTLMTSRFISTQGKSARYVRSESVLSPALKDDVALVMSDLPNGRALARAFYVDVSDRYAANQRVCLLRVRDLSLYNPRFLYYVANRNKQLLRYDTGVDQTHLKKNWITDIKLPFPAISEQNRIVSVLDKFDRLVNEMSEGLSAEIYARRKQYEHYHNKLLTFQERTV